MNILQQFDTNGSDFAASSQNLTTSGFRKVSKAEPCPLCGKPDWCKVADDGTVMCSRTDSAPIGWKRIKTNADGHGIFKPESALNRATPKTRKSQSRSQKQKVAPKTPSVPIPENLKLLKLDKPAVDCPQPQVPTLIPNGVPANAKQITYEYSKTQFVHRFEWDDPENPKGRSKTYRQSHVDGDGKTVWTKGEREWQAYRAFEVRKHLYQVTEGTPIVLLQEGEPSVELARAIGLASTTLQGSNWTEESILAILDEFAAVTSDDSGFAIAFLYDNDAEGLKKALAVKAACDKKGIPCVLVNPLDIYPEIPEKGDIKEILDAMDAPEFIRRLEAQLHAAATAVDSSQQGFDRESEGNNSPAQSKTKQMLNLLDAQYGERLRLNEMTQQIELDGEECKLDLLYLRIAEELDTDIGRDRAADIASQLAARNTYSPVRDYLESVVDEERINLDELASRYFGTADPLHATLIKRTLIAAVARAFQPGCKHDTLCILQGKQGYFKSSFWATLANGFFTDNLNDANEKDEKLKLRRYWILEYAEFETAYKRKEVEQLKGFLSASTDSIRKPYGRSIEDFPRTSIFVGTTNRQEFLQDPTGERRYWVIPVKQKIPIEPLEEERDRIWGEAVRLYRAGEKWWLTAEEDAQLADANKGWQASDLWEAEILNYLDNRSECTISDILSKAIGLDIAQQSKREQMRVSDILCRHGWEKAKNPKRIGGRLQRYWEKIQGSNGGGNGGGNGVVTPPSSYQATVSSEVLPPVTTFSSNFSRATDSAVAASEHSCGESFGEVGGNSQPQDGETLSEQAFEGVTTSVLPPPPESDLDVESLDREKLATEIARGIVPALRRNSYTTVQSIEQNIVKCEAEGKVTREAVYRHLSPYQVGIYEDLLKHNSVASSPCSVAEIASPSLKVGERVEIVGGDIKHFIGVKGKIIDVSGDNCAVEFDTPIGNADFCDFPRSDLRKL